MVAIYLLRGVLNSVRCTKSQIPLQNTSHSDKKPRYSLVALPVKTARADIGMNSRADGLPFCASCPNGLTYVSKGWKNSLFVGLSVLLHVQAWIGGFSDLMDEIRTFMAARQAPFRLKGLRAIFVSADDLDEEQQVGLGMR